MSDNVPFVISHPGEHPEILRKRFQEWGYLYLKSFVDSARCEAQLNEILQATAPYVVRPQGSQFPQLVGDPFYETDAIWDEIYPKVQSLESFHSFFHQADLLELMQQVVNDNVFVYPIKMARISTPRKVGYETPPHQDAYSHHAGPTMAGIWVALHDISEAMGRVKVLPKSHLEGVRKVFQAEGVGGIQCEIYPQDTQWHVSDFDQGDILIFHSCTVHRAEPNLTRETARISIDTRFCDYGAPVFSTNLEPHHGWRIESLGWETIYAGWSNKALQYYWQTYPNLF
jgi:ectoine hydroxylase-related dioxygenase (phytanoyl-CoA dioxygenase family)